MGIRLSSMSISRYTLLVGAQLVVNVTLALWLYNEYLHNPFMQAYMSSVWSVIWPEVTVAAGILVGVAGSLAAYNRGHLRRLIKVPPQGMAQGASNLAAIDVCPFCNLPLKTISEGRLQCRNCRRYFKSNLPKVSV